VAAFNRNAWPQSPESAISEETLRQRHARGEGPRRTQQGRFWSYTYDDLDAYAESTA
jgi:hypothetical protein